LAPYAAGGVDPESPGWKNVYGPLSAWSGYLHDLGMGANARLFKEMAYFDGLTGDALAAEAIKANPRWKELVDWLVDGILRETFHVDVAAAKPLREKGYKAIAKDQLVSSKDGIRARHSLNSTLYCVG